MSADSSSAIQGFALHGAGVALLPEWLVKDDLAKGALKHLLPAYRFPQQGIYAVYPGTRYVSAKVRAFIDFLKSKSVPKMPV